MEGLLPSVEWVSEYLVLFLHVNFVALKVYEPVREERHALVGQKVYPESVS